MKQGITRLEFSSYFYSYKEQTQNINVQLFQQRIDDALTQINLAPAKINYIVTFADMWHSFWEQARSIFYHLGKYFNCGICKESCFYLFWTICENKFEEGYN